MLALDVECMRLPGSSASLLHLYVIPKAVLTEPR